MKLLLIVLIVETVVNAQLWSAVICFYIFLLALKAIWLAGMNNKVVAK